MLPWEASVHRRGHCSFWRANVYQHPDMVGWHLVLRAVTSKGKQNWELEKEPAQILLEFLVKEEKKRNQHWLRRKRQCREKGRERSALFVWRVKWRTVHVCGIFYELLWGCLCRDAGWRDLKTLYDRHIALFQKRLQDGLQHWAKWSQIISREWLPTAVFLPENPMDRGVW